MTYKRCSRCDAEYQGSERKHTCQQDRHSTKAVRGDASPSLEELEERIAALEEAVFEDEEE